ncbi:MAG: hypothetical protein AAFU85_22235 [Planctomycetota bacterium]
MNRLLIVLGLCVVTALTPSFCVAEDSEKDPLDGLKCFIMPKRDVKGKKVMDYKGAKLYVCCSSCVKRMTKTPEKYEAKANHQLVQTGQFKQAACPLSGGAVGKSSPDLKIGGVLVQFSSEEHKAKVAMLDGDKQIEAVFGAKGFKTGKFALIKKTS